MKRSVSVQASSGARGATLRRSARTPTGAAKQAAGVADSVAEGSAKRVLTGRHRAAEPHPAHVPALSAENPPTRCAVKAGAVELAKADSLDDAAAHIFSSALDQFVANMPAALETSAPENVHQMRVGLRRLRAAIGLLRPAITSPALETARAQAKIIAAALGAARDWDVFHDMLDAGPGAAFDDRARWRALIEIVESRRIEAYHAARARLDAPETTLFVSRMHSVIAQRDWSGAEAAKAAGSARCFAATALTRLRKRARKKSRGLATLSPDARHKARIALKKARYGAEFFHGLFAHQKSAREFSQSLAEMQDGLGLFNDIKTADRLLVSIGHEGGAAADFARGWFACAAQAGVAHAHRSETRLRALKPFWR